ncbi:hypothetical protein PAF17_18435 [Paracoccus sp. Z330]|uniref:Uncharacterized protein n=1 Tax=Paracoccus onchidii TaxID=3017813 RepID=A0ABT4ZJT1_9RHOB|nr:hypothetical protein [Paracoccus onchidii]MDB6179464.1 hypothetical protein [Paracoccus onchidii]
MPERPLFLERASFRRRRLGDAARILPVLAALVILAPVWWVPALVSSGGGATAFFVLWALLIMAIRVLHRALLRAEAATMRAQAEAMHDDDGPAARDKDGTHAV